MQPILYNTFSRFKFDIKDLMTSWTQLKHYLVINVTHHHLSRMTISTKNTLNQTLEVPITLTTQDNSNFNNTHPYGLIPVTSNDIHNHILKSNLSGWVIFNVQQTGEYRQLNSIFLCITNVLYYIHSCTYV